MYNFDNKYLSLYITESHNILQIKGQVKNPQEYVKMIIFAANPIDIMANYTGSALPFPNAEIAFEGSLNSYTISNTGTINTLFKTPNSFYSTDTLTKIVPSIFIKLVSYKTDSEPIIVHFKLEDKFPLKTLFYRKERTGPDFYQKKWEVIGIQSQDKILSKIGEIKIKYNCA
jgi:hypothetical protein